MLYGSYRYLYNFRISLLKWRIHPKTSSLVGFEAMEIGTSFTSSPVGKVVRLDAADEWVKKVIKSPHFWALFWNVNKRLSSGFFKPFNYFLHFVNKNIKHRRQEHIENCLNVVDINILQIVTREKPSTTLVLTTTSLSLPPSAAYCQQKVSDIQKASIFSVYLFRTQR